MRMLLMGWVGSKSQSDSVAAPSARSLWASLESAVFQVSMLVETLSRI